MGQGVCLGLPPLEGGERLGSWALLLGAALLLEDSLQMCRAMHVCVHTTHAHMGTHRNT